MFCLFLDIYICTCDRYTNLGKQIEILWSSLWIAQAVVLCCITYKVSEYGGGGGGGGGVPNIKGLLHLLQVEILIYVHSY